MLEAFGLSDPGCVRTNNEDYYLLAPDMGLYLVADGMGGAQAGEHASRIASETVAEYVWQSQRSDARVLEEAFELANHRVMEQAKLDATLEGMGTTLVAVLEDNGELHVTSVGDSRGYLFEDGMLRPITDDQTWVNEVGRRLGIEEAALKTHPMRHVLTMAVGVSTPLRVHSYVLKPRAGSVLVLCSDGLHGVLDEKTLEETLNQKRDFEDAAHYLIDAAKHAGGPDNITVVLLRVVE
ncbi:MAG: protein phosphatase 2C domain-containing protein [Acidobacteria bacterium]|nr:protein phosphatase 2C domain-containing protein [Acidobacteriota bacterium]